jgi:1-acyl-sn-glycerol-3-phosphate acyltransferase
VARRTYGFWYRLAAVIAKPPLILVAKRDWRGLENIPTSGGFLTAVNHSSYLDTLVYAHFQYNTGRPARLLAKAGLFKMPFVKQIMYGTGMIPVYRNSASAGDALRAAITAVEEGECVAFYPEGTLTRDPGLWPMTAKNGVARVALATGAPVIPIAQWGSHRIMPPYAKGGKGNRRFMPFPRKTVHVVAGPPVDLDRFLGKEPTPDVLREATDAVMDAITALLEELRGEKAPAERYDMRRAAAGKAAAKKAENSAEAAAAKPAEPTDPEDPAKHSQFAQPDPESAASAGPVSGSGASAQAGNPTEAGA